MDELAPKETLTQAEEAYVAAHARCLLWHAWVDQIGVVYDWKLTFVDTEAARRFLPVTLHADGDFATAVWQSKHPQDRDDSDRRAIAALQECRDYSQDFRCYLADGTERWLREDVTVERLSPTRWRLVGVVTDISELKVREAQFRQLADSIPQIAWIQSVDGEIEYLNEQFFKRTGTQEFEGVAKSWATLVLPADAERAQPNYRAALANGQSWQAELRLRMADGSYRWYLCQLVPLRDELGRIVRWFGTGTDVHAQKALEEELERRVQERTKELVHAYDEMEAFNYSVSHDLRAPARAIHFACSVLLDEHGPEMGEAARIEIRRAMDGASRMGRLIDELLQYSRLHRREVVRSRVDLSTIAHLVLEDLGGPGSAEVVIQPNMIADADAGLVRVVIQNLLENALKFSQPCQNPRIEFGFASQAYFVRDQGVGFDPTYADKLFEPFQRLHRSDEFPGTGIGLANVRRIIDRHGGRVWAEGAVGAGATFWFTVG